ncbi:hypothetical protein ABFX02_02G107700 [Erythranthe guttata]
MDRRGRGRPKKIASDNFDQIPVKRGEDLPEFFKIYVPAIYSERLRIPPDFIEKFGGNIPETVTLKKTPGISFQADINRIDDDDDWFIEKGWPEFVKENSVEESDFLIFTYAGNAVFNVKVFSKNGCIKRVDNLPEDEPSEFEPESENSEDNQSEERNLSPRRPSERETVCGNRYFSVKLKKSCVTRGWLHIPSEFWRTHLGADKRGLRMVTLKVKEKSWKVGITSKSFRAVFSKGWGKFVIDNSLRTGNSCMFMLIHDGHDLVFKVLIDK